MYHADVNYSISGMEGGRGRATYAFKNRVQSQVTDFIITNMIIGIIFLQ